MSAMPSPQPLHAFGLPVALSDGEFVLLQALFYEQIGIQLPLVKKPLVCGRLAKRLAALGLSSYQQYYQYLLAPQGAAELEIAIDLITTHETYFFREPKHFEFLQQRILPAYAQQTDFRVWSAACSTGEEAYTLAMLLHEARSHARWRVLGSDISRPVLGMARRGLYPLERGSKIPNPYLKRYCLKGQGQYLGYFLLEQCLRDGVEFAQANLNLAMPALGMFDLILLRNVLIYFDQPTKLRVLHNVVQHLKPGGWLMVGHSEALHQHDLPLQQVATSIYRRVGP
ncbi:CheR family methyltransferase [Pseudomonas sp. 5P_3.1_Bac2]|uniref:CheR family methyltransferase n=1 Tax=Pseudomonas sp. 5P_3.1_Bac2 TaxID=2971617 RepID=UPI0021C6BECA|nr:protein-glutamate O-methyltransferase CheR [Pseudomonas sp. 5P_3.1_Bac2]MCU1719426.1 protein-glutamate O-methyltransferase CheR [Pseudomonas sp. 5P_3.1_Bac2]